ncbi:hypothetical protein BUALT_Bualt01G0199700 [Buddleja alternifolia]|uniref:DUF4371 domain-containing protein n=1 Tax=Buddleja alternifolia TaxID=168488 RepID=A0AAV6Y9J7_9LAMI|nr:hypothetical protein BUALT_Bualt01G0199700 [Buddleja alternifolia]
MRKVNRDSDCPHIERDPGLRKSIWDYPLTKRDEIRRAYLIFGPFHGIPEKSSKNVDKNKRKFLPAWYKLFPGIAFRARNERTDSHNHGSFIEIIKHTASYNDEVNSIVLENAPHNASYTSPPIQKEILSIYAMKIQKFIKDEIGEAKYCIILDESRDESKREQMAIVLRFVDIKGFIRESIQNIRGQKYDGASNIRGEWNGLQALFLSECPYAYYVHCFAHRLQLILVAAALSVIPIEHFFSHLLVVINLVDSSSKRHDQLQIAQAIRIVELISNDELEMGKGKKQVGIVQCPGDTQWGSHLRSLRSLLVVNTRELIQEFRENGWDELFDKVKAFCEKHEIDIPNMNAPHRSGRGQSV